jgi:flavin prenyltransferase
MNQAPYVVAVTGASGAIYGLRFVQAITQLGFPIAFTMSESARIVLREELGIEISDLRNHKFLTDLFPSECLALISYYPHNDLTAPIASGSYPTRGMIVIPASTAAFSRIANGISTSLIDRAAECAIKEGRNAFKRDSSGEFA